jgi:hypothetical protein
MSGPDRPDTRATRRANANKKKARNPTRDRRTGRAERMVLAATVPVRGSRPGWRVTGTQADDSDAALRNAPAARTAWRVRVGKIDSLSASVVKTSKSHVILNRDRARLASERWARASP